MHHRGVLPAWQPNSTSASLSIVRRGYDRTQVEERLRVLATELEAAAVARSASLDDVRALSRQVDSSRSDAQVAREALTDTRAELDRTRAQVAELSIVPQAVDGMSERLQQMVRIAQDEVNDMRTRATTGAAHVLALAQAEADELRQRSETERRQFEAERQAAEEALRAQLEESRTRLDQLRNDSNGQKVRLDAEFADRRTRAEAELTAEIEARRSALLQDLAALEARQRQEADRVLDQAAQDARTRVAEATANTQRIRGEARDDVDAAHRALEELRSLQHQVAEQLTSVRALLDWTLPQLDTAGRSPASDGSRAKGTGPAGEQRVDPSGRVGTTASTTGPDADMPPDQTQVAVHPAPRARVGAAPVGMPPAAEACPAPPRRDAGVPD